MSLRNHFEELVDLQPDERAARLTELQLSYEDATILAGMFLSPLGCGRQRLLSISISSRKTMPSLSLPPW